MGLDFTIQYRKGKENRTADALSRRDEGGNCHAISAALPVWIQELIRSYDTTEWIKERVAQLAVQAGNPQGYTLTNGVLRYKGRLVVGRTKHLRSRL